MLIITRHLNLNTNVFPTELGARAGVRDGHSGRRLCPLHRHKVQEGTVSVAERVCPHPRHQVGLYQGPSVFGETFVLFTGGFTLVYATIFSTTWNCSHAWGRQFSLTTSLYYDVVTSTSYNDVGIETALIITNSYGHSQPRKDASHRSQCKMETLEDTHQSPSTSPKPMAVLGPSVCRARARQTLFKLCHICHARSRSRSPITMSERIQMQPTPCATNKVFCI